jgi:hypothetical protein
MGRNGLVIWCIVGSVLNAENEISAACIGEGDAMFGDLGPVPSRWVAREGEERFFIECGAFLHGSA